MNRIIPPRAPRSTLCPSRSHSHTRNPPPISQSPASANSASDVRTSSGLMARSPPRSWSPGHGIIRLVPQRSRAKVWVLFFLMLFLAVVASVSYLGWPQTVPGVQSLSTPPRFLGQKTPFTVVLEARRGNVTQVEVRVAQSGKATTVAKQEGALGGRVEIPVVVD